GDEEVAGGWGYRMGPLPASGCSGNGRGPAGCPRGGLQLLVRTFAVRCLPDPGPGQSSCRAWFGLGHRDAPGISPDRWSCAPAGLHKTVRAEMTVPVVADGPSGSGGRADPAGQRRPVTGLPGARVVRGSFFRRVGRAPGLVWPAPQFLLAPAPRPD